MPHITGCNENPFFYYSADNNSFILDDGEDASQYTDNAIDYGDYTEELQEYIESDIIDEVADTDEEKELVRGARVKAANLILSAMSSGSDTLDLSHLALDELPPSIPNSIRSIDFSHNNIWNSTILGYPGYSHITSIKCSFNKLQSINDLPESLKSIDCSNNRIKEFPSSYPTLLKELICSNNPLGKKGTTEVLYSVVAFENLPSRLEVIEFRGCFISNLADGFPSSLLKIDASNNFIEEYPYKALFNVDTGCSINLESNPFRNDDPLEARYINLTGKTVRNREDIKEEDKRDEKVFSEMRVRREIKENIIKENMLSDEDVSVVRKLIENEFDEAACAVIIENIKAGKADDDQKKLLSRILVVDKDSFIFNDNHSKLPDLKKSKKVTKVEEKSVSTQDLALRLEKLRADSTTVSELEQEKIAIPLETNATGAVSLNREIKIHYNEISSEQAKSIHSLFAMNSIIPSDKNRFLTEMNNFISGSKRMDLEKFIKTYLKSQEITKKYGHMFVHDENNTKEILAIGAAVNSEVRKDLANLAGDGEKQKIDTASTLTDVKKHVDNLKSDQFEEDKRAIKAIDRLTLHEAITIFSKMVCNLGEKVQDRCKSISQKILETKKEADKASKDKGAKESESELSVSSMIDRYRDILDDPNLSAKDKRAKIKRIREKNANKADSAVSIVRKHIPVDSYEDKINNLNNKRTRLEKTKSMSEGFLENLNGGISRNKDKLAKFSLHVSVESKLGADYKVAENPSTVSIDVEKTVESVGPSIKFKDGKFPDKTELIEGELMANGKQAQYEKTFAIKDNVLTIKTAYKNDSEYARLPEKVYNERQFRVTESYMNVLEKMVKYTTYVGSDKNSYLKNIKNSLHRPTKAEVFMRNVIKSLLVERPIAGSSKNAELNTLYRIGEITAKYQSELMEYKAKGDKAIHIPSADTARRELGDALSDARKHNVWERRETAWVDKLNAHELFKLYCEISDNQCLKLVDDVIDLELELVDLGDSEKEKVKAKKIEKDIKIFNNFINEQENLKAVFSEYFVEGKDNVDLYLAAAIDSRPTPVRQYKLDEVVQAEREFGPGEVIRRFGEDVFEFVYKQSIPSQPTTPEELEALEEAGKETVSIIAELPSIPDDEPYKKEEVIDALSPEVADINNQQKNEVLDSEKSPLESESQVGVLATEKASVDVQAKESPTPASVTTPKPGQVTQMEGGPNSGEMVRPLDKPLGDTVKAPVEPVVARQKTISSAKGSRSYLDIEHPEGTGTDFYSRECFNTKKVFKLCVGVFEDSLRGLGKSALNDVLTVVLKDKSLRDSYKAGLLELCSRNKILSYDEVKRIQKDTHSSLGKKIKEATKYFDKNLK